MDTKKREAAVRRKLAKEGLRLEKSRVRTPHCDDHGGYRIIDNAVNGVVAGSRFDLDRADVEAYVEERVEAR